MQPPLSPCTAPGSAPALRLQLEGITKRYPAVVANDGIDLAVRAGEIHALLGENGAGKSTLMKIIYGAVRPDAGVVRVDGQRVHIRNPQQARHLGIAMVFQHFSLFDSLSVAENVWLGLDREPGLAEVTRRIRETATRYGLEVDPLRPVYTLSVGEMQRVEIIRALLSNPRLLILDEPTSVLTPQAVEKLFVVLRQLASEGCSIVYISHKLHEIRALCSACTVVRAGRVAGVCDPRQESNASLSRWMIGAEPPALQHQAREPGDVVLRVQQLSLARTQAFGVDLQGIELQVRAGEVVGLAGLVGAGRTEVLRAIFGADAFDTGTVTVKGKPSRRRGIARGIEQGLGLVPEDRKHQGLVLGASVADNMGLVLLRDATRAGVVNLGRLAELARRGVESLRIRTPNTKALVKNLSGGNQQKVVMGKWLLADPTVLLLDEPTRGVDVGAKVEIYNLINDMTSAGRGVLMASSDLPEVVGICDRILVMAQGRIVGELSHEEATQATVMALAVQEMESTRAH